MIKPLGRKVYGSIGHLPSSRLGPGDHCVSDGQAKICIEQVRDKHDTVIVQEKLDGSCTAVALIDDTLHALGRAGWPARSSPHIQHQMFDKWVDKHADRFRSVLREGERIVGEWLAQAHGTLYDLKDHEPFFAFDLMIGSKRAPYKIFIERLNGEFDTPHLLFYGNQSISVEDAMSIHKNKNIDCDQVEGLVYRVERKGKLDYLSKYVRQDKIDGKYLPEMSGKQAIWNWVF